MEQKIIVRAVFILCLAAFVVTGWIFLSEDKAKQDIVSGCKAQQEIMKEELANWASNRTSYCKAWTTFRRMNCKDDNSEVAKSLDMTCGVV